MAVSAFQLHNSNRDGVPSDMKCKRPKHGLTPFRVAWPTACRFTQRPCGQYNSVGRICQISRPSCHCEGAPRPWQSVLFCASGGVLSLGFCRGGALPRPLAFRSSSLYCLRRVTFVNSDKSNQKRHSRGKGFRFPFPLENPPTLKRPKGRGRDPSLWKPHPGGLGDYQIAPLPRSGKGR